MYVTSRGGVNNLGDSNPILTLCIPTYNRVGYLDTLLNSIVQQLRDGIEVVISDNGSSDGTHDLVRNYQVQGIPIIYHRFSSNQGADVNFQHAVKMARGRYCWLLGSDDALVEGALDSILGEITDGQDIYLCNRVNCDVRLRPTSIGAWLSSPAEPASFELSDTVQLEAYLNLAQSIGAVFSYLSSIVFRRDKWAAVTLDQAFIGTGYSHVFVLLSFVSLGCRLKYVPAALVYCRGDNDSFATGSMAARALIDIDGYALIADKIFATQPSVKRALIAVLRRECNRRYLTPFYKLLKVKAFSKPDDWNRLVCRCREVGIAPFYLKVVDLLPVSKGFVVFLLALKRRLSSYRGKLLPR